MILEYSQLKGKIKVGDRVRAVPGKFNPCRELKDDGSNEQKITDVGLKTFSINDWLSGYSSDFSVDSFLDLNPGEPENPKTLSNLEVGDEVEEDGNRRTVLAKLDGCYLLSCSYIMRSENNEERIASRWYTVYELEEDNRFSIVQPKELKPEVEAARKLLEGEGYRVERAV